MHQSRKTVSVVVPFLFLSDSKGANDGTVKLANDQWSIAEGKKLVWLIAAYGPPSRAALQIATGHIGIDTLIDALAAALAALAPQHGLPILPPRVARR